MHLQGTWASPGAAGRALCIPAPCGAAKGSRLLQRLQSQPCRQPGAWCVPEARSSMLATSLPVRMAKVRAAWCSSADRAARPSRAPCTSSACPDHTLWHCQLAASSTARARPSIRGILSAAETGSISRERRGGLHSPARHMQRVSSVAQAHRPVACTTSRRRRCTDWEGEGGLPAMAAIPSKEITTAQVAAVSFGFFSDEEVGMSSNAQALLAACV